MEKIVYVYVGNLDRKELIKAIYNHFRSQEIEMLYQRIIDYKPSINKEDLIAQITDAQLEEYAKEDSITSINNIFLHINFSSDDYISFDENYITEYIDAIFHLKRQKGLLDKEELQPRMQELASIDAIIQCYEERVKDIKKAKNQLRALVEGTTAHQSEDEVAKFAELGRDKWQVEEEIMGWKLKRRSIIFQLLCEEAFLVWDSNPSR